MQILDRTLIDLETRFWQSIVDHDTEAALAMLNEPAIMVSSHGAMKFDHAGYKKMADQGSMVLKSFEIEDMEVFFPNKDTAVLTYGVKQTMASQDRPNGFLQEMLGSSTWFRAAEGWRCVLHTETPKAQKACAA